jgi:hypothetical protein
LDIEESAAIVKYLRLLCALLSVPPAHVLALDDDRTELTGRLFFTQEERATIDAAALQPANPTQATRLDGVLISPNQPPRHWINGQLNTAFQASSGLRSHPAPNQVGNQSDRPLLPENALRIERRISLP